MAEQPVTAELFYSGGWHTAPMYTRDVMQITRGSGDEQGEPPPSSASSTLDNRSLAYNPRNPSSPLYGLIGRYTPLRYRLATPAQDFIDTFSGSFTNSWAPEWSLATLGGSGNDFDVAAGVGTQVVDGAAEYRLAYVTGKAAVNGEALLGPIDLPTAAVTGGSLEPANIAVRLRDANSYYLFRVEYTTAEALRVQIYAPGGSSPLADVQAYSSAQWTPGEDIMVRAQWDGPQLRARVWPASVAEPVGWQATATDDTYLGPGSYGIRSGAASGSTNVPATFGYSAFTVSTWDVRFIGEAASWRPRQTEDFAAGGIRGDAWTGVTANGILRRLGQGAPPVRSPFRRSIMSPEHAGLLAYWPCEDEPDATQAVSAMPGQPPMTVAGTVEFAALDPSLSPGNTVRRGTKALPELKDGGSLNAPVPAGVSSPVEWAVQFYGGLYTSGFDATCVLASWQTPGGTYARWEVVLTEPSGNTDVIAYTAAGAPTTVLQYPGQVIDAVEYRVDAIQAGANVDVRLKIKTKFGFLLEDSDTLAGNTLARVTRFTSNPNLTVVTAGLTCGHVQVWDDRDAPSFAYGVASPSQTTPGLASTAYIRETVADRLARLCIEDSVPFRLIGAATDTPAMGSQPDGTLIDLLAEGARTDGGLLYEAREFIGLVYRTRRSLYNQTAALALDFTDGQIAAPIEPDVDDLAVRNDVTVRRPGGGSATAVQETGPLSVLPPPAGVGRVTTQVDVNTSTDGALPDQAAWRLHLGTVDETRYPSITVDLDAPDVTVALIAAASAVDIGDLITIDNLEADQVMLMVLGYGEPIGSHRRTITYNCAPARPWEIFVLDDARLGRLASDGTTLNNGQDETGTNLDLNTPVGPLWSITDEPYDLIVAGERVTVTVNNDATNTQNVTVTRSVNGVVKTQLTGATVDLWRPGVLGL